MRTNQQIIHFAASTLACVMLLQSVACAPTRNDDADEASLRQSENLSDEELFRELMFPNAEAAAKIPELARVYEFVGYESMTDAQREATEVTTDIIVDNIQQIDPEFMQNFAAGITSGDVQAVEAAMMDAQAVMRESMQMLSADFDLLLNEDNVDILRERLNEDVGQDAAKLLLELKTLDPETLGLVVQGVHGHLADIGLPATGQQIANAIDSQVNLALQLQSVLQVSSQLQDATDVSLNSATNLVQQTDVNASLDTVQHLQLQANVENQNAIALEKTIEAQIDNQLSLDSQTANFVDLNASNAAGSSTAVALAVAVVAVAVAVVVVAVVEVAHPIEGMSLFNGDDNALFRESMIANITEVYQQP